MKLPFLDRREEVRRLQRLLRRDEGSLGVLYGRRRCGKSRILREIMPARGSVFYVGDEREAALQRTSLAGEIARLLEGFGDVSYPDWEGLLARWWREARRGSVLIVDELPSLVARAPELPSLLQKHIDRDSARGVHLLVAGSSQRMMQGLVLDRSAPLYGRAGEVLDIAPLPAGWIGEALAVEELAGCGHGLFGLGRGPQILGAGSGFWRPRVRASRPRPGSPRRAPRRAHRPAAG